jgi:signal transduction histidine kinase/ActR/RegA family two-component response regulator
MDGDSVSSQDSGRPGADGWMAAPAGLSLVAPIAGGGIAAGGSWVLARWTAGLPDLAPGMSRMVPSAALCFVLLGLALLFRRWPGAEPRGSRPRYLAAAAPAAAVLVAGLARIGQYLGLALPLDFDRFVPAAWVPAGGAAMTPSTAVGFVLLGTALVLPRYRYFHLFQALVMAAILLAGLSMGRHLYGGQPLLPLAQMAMPTTLFFLVAGVGALCLRPERGLVALMNARGEGGKLLRQLLVAALLAPPLLGWLLLAGQRRGYYELEGGLTLFAYSNLILFGALVWWAAARLGRSDAGREAAELRTRFQLERLGLLHQITRATVERQDPASIFKVVVKHLEERLPVDFGAYFRFADGGRMLEVGCLGAQGRALAHGLIEPEGGRQKIDGAGLELCLAGRLVYEEDVSLLHRPFPRNLAELGLRSAVLAPLQAENGVFGLLVVARKRPAAFHSGECEFLNQLAENVAVAWFQGELHGSLAKAYFDLRTTQQSALERDRLRALGEMASGVAHDINNSISPAALHLESLLERGDGLPDKARERLEIVRRAVHDVAHTVSRMQELYRHRKPGQHSLIQLNPLVEQVLELTRSKWRDTPQERGIVIEAMSRLAADLPLVRGSESEIREALTNLVFNAVDAMPDGGLLSLRSRVLRAPSGAAAAAGEGLLVALEVGDSGIGMDAETRRRCLEPFFTTKGDHGSGLGLPMVFGIAERHGGTVEIDSEPGQGSTIRLLFPAVAGEPTPPSTAEIAVAGKLRVLVIDDDPTLRETLVEVFRADGHQVVGADGGAQGIETFKAAHRGGAPSFDLVVTDLGMPQVDGRQVAAAIKKLAPTLPIILLTGWGHRMISEGDKPENIDFVLSKPPRLKELRQALARLRQD